MRKVRGTDLQPATRDQALARFVHRSVKGKVYPGHGKPLFDTDDEWLTNTFFYVRKDGKLSDAHGHCETYIVSRVRP